MKSSHNSSADRITCQNLHDSWGCFRTARLVAIVLGLWLRSTRRGRRTEARRPTSRSPNGVSKTTTTTTTALTPRTNTSTDHTSSPYLDQRHAVEHVGHDDHFKMGFRSFGHVMRPRLVDESQHDRIETLLQLGAHTILNHAFGRRRHCGRSATSQNWRRRRRVRVHR